MKPRAAPHFAARSTSSALLRETGNEVLRVEFRRFLTSADAQIARVNKRARISAQSLNRVARNDRAIPGRSPPHENGELHGQAKTKLQTGISPTKSAWKTSWRFTRRGPRSRTGRRTDTSCWDRHNPRGPEESGLKMIKHGSSLKAAASANRISQERLRRYLRENTEATRIGKVWRIIDLRRFHLPIYSRGQIVEVWFSDAEAAKAGEYLSAVGRFLPTGDNASETLCWRWRSRRFGRLPSVRDGAEQPLPPRQQGRTLGARDLQDPRMRAGHGGV